MGANSDWERVGGGENWRLIRNGGKKLQFDVFNTACPYHTDWLLLLAIGWKVISILTISYVLFLLR